MTTSTTSTRAVLASMYAAEAEYLSASSPGTADFSVLAPYFSPTIILRQDPSLPYGGTWRGHDGMERFFEVMSRTWASFDLMEQEVLADGATAVVRTHVHARARQTGAELRFPVLQTLEVHRGRITEVRPYYWDVAAIAAACTGATAGRSVTGPRI